MDDCNKYKMFVEDNYMLEFMIWEDKILPLKIANNDYGDNTIDITD